LDLLTSKYYVATKRDEQKSVERTSAILQQETKRKKGKKNKPALELEAGTPGDTFSFFLFVIKVKLNKGCYFLRICT